MDDPISRRAAIDAFWHIKCNLQMMDDTQTADKMMHGLRLAENAIELLPSAQPEQQWILCSERLPEESGRYLISAFDGVRIRRTVAQYQPRYKAWAMTGRRAYWKVIAWMPLPDPWKGE